MGDVKLEIKLNKIDEGVRKIEESGGGSGGDGYITSVSNDFNVVNKKLSLSNDVTTKLSKVDTTDNLSVELAKKINKPVSATNGQVLTYNGTSNEWEAQDSKGGGGGSAQQTIYDNSTSGLASTNVQAAIDEIAGGWKYHGEFPSNSNIQLPNKFDELLVVGDLRDSAQKTSIHIPRIELTSSQSNYSCGEYMNSSVNSGMMLNVSNTLIKLQYGFVNGKDETTKSKMKIYYK